MTTANTRESNSVVWQKMSGQGGTTQTLALPKFDGPTAPVLTAPDGYVVDIPAGVLKTQIANMVKKPGFGYLNTLQLDKKTQWNQVQLAYDHWQYQQEGLTEAGSALVAIAVAIATNGTAVGLVTTGTSTAVMEGAVYNALISQASISLINNKGDIGKTLKDLGSRDTVKSVVAAALSAGVANEIGANSLLNDLGKNQWQSKIITNVISDTGSSLVGAAINGGSLSDALVKGVLSGTVTTLHADIAGEIKGLEDNSNVTNYILHKVAHAAAGCAAAAAQKQACEAGAIGAGVGEIVAGLMPKPDNLLTMSQTEYAEYQKKVITTSQLVAGTVAAYAGFDVNAATAAANTAISNNYLTDKQWDEVTDKLKQCGFSLSCQDKIRTQYQALSELNDSELEASCANGMTSSCVNRIEQLNAGLKRYNEYKGIGVNLGYFESLADFNSRTEASSKARLSIQAYNIRTQAMGWQQDNCNGLSDSACAVKFQSSLDSAYANHEAASEKMRNIVDAISLFPITGTVLGEAESLKTLFTGKDLLGAEGNRWVAMAGVVTLGVSKYSKLGSKAVSKIDDYSVCNGTACFVAGTMIQTNEGLKAIETFVGGELVWARNDETFEYGFRPVEATKSTQNKRLYEVIVSNNNNEQEVFYTTAEHPFWVKDHGWRKASLLDKDMILLDKNDQPIRVISQTVTTQMATVFNIQVQEAHTYHIGELGVWVHNADCCSNMKQLFNLDGFGQNLAAASQKTSKRYDGQTIYSARTKIGEYIKKGDQYYLDAPHSDHIEVFNKFNEFKVVLNLDGTINLEKTAKALGRTIPK